MSIRFLIGSPEMDAVEIESEQRDDARRAAPAVSDDAAREMAAAFGWDEPPTAEEWGHMFDEWEADSRRSGAAA